MAGEEGTYLSLIIRAEGLLSTQSFVSTLQEVMRHEPAL